MDGGQHPALRARNHRLLRPVALHVRQQFSGGPAVRQFRPALWRLRQHRRRLQRGGAPPAVRRNGDDGIPASLSRHARPEKALKRGTYKLHIRGRRGEMPNRNAGAAAMRPGSLLVPLVYAISCFFIWGLAYGLLDVLNKHFQDTLHIGKAQSTWLQMAYFGAYLLMSLPAGLIMQARGYKAGILSGLVVTAFGAFLFIPSAQAASFPL